MRLQNHLLLKFLTGTLFPLLLHGFQQSHNHHQMVARAETAIGATTMIMNGTIPTGNQQYVVMKILSSDTKTNQTLIQMIPVSDKNSYEPRIVLKYQSRFPYVSISENTPNDTVVAAVIAKDEDPGPSGSVSLSIEQGNELGHFKLVSTPLTNTIQVSGAPLSRARVPEYNLTIVARDHGQPQKLSSVNLVIKLDTSTLTPLLEPQTSLRPPVTDLMYVGGMLVAIFSALIIFIIAGCALVQRPSNKKGPPPRAASSTNSRLHPSDHCLCLGLTNL